MPSPPKFKTAKWRGIVHPHLASSDELVTKSIQLPKELDDDVAMAAYEYRRWFDSEEEVIATAICWAIQSLAENPPPTGRSRKRPTKSGR